MELPIVTEKAVALRYDTSSAQWIELGSEFGTCTLSILKSPSNEYRYVAQKISNSEVVLNAYIFPEMKYDESTATFHQWYDKSKTAFGLNFADAAAAKKFGAAMACTLEQLNVPQVPQKTSGVSAERPAIPAGGFNSIKKASENTTSRSHSKVSPYATSNVGSSVTQNNSTSSSKVTSVKPSAGAPPPPGPPPSAPVPPGPPPAVPTVAKPSNAPGNDFASQLQRAAAEHKQVDVEAHLNKPSTVVAEPKPSTPVPASGGMDFLTEMRMKMNKKAAGESPSTAKSNPSKLAPTIAASVNPPLSTKFPTVDSEPSSCTYVTAADLVKFRNDLMNDIIFNMDKMKNEIITTISSRLN